MIPSIDHINVRAQNFIAQSALIETKLADHYFVSYSLSHPHTSASIVSDKDFSIVGPRLCDKQIMEHDWYFFFTTVSPVHI